MGVSGFVTKYLKNLQSQSEIVRKNCAVFFADYNQCLYECMEAFSYRDCHRQNEEDIQKNRCRIKAETAEEAFKLMEKNIRDNISSRISLLATYQSLEEIYIAMDGSPCLGKIQQQMKRRKESRKFVIGDKIIFSNSLTLPGTPFVNLFAKILDELYTEFVEKSKDRDGNYRLKLTKSLNDISGEGEHKILDMVRKHKYTDYSQNSGEKVVLILSADSDSVISLIHQNVSSVYVETKVYFSATPTDKIISIDEVRKTIVVDLIMLKNIPFMIALAGNDFLPEMLNAQNFDVLHDVCISICVDPKKRTPLSLTKEFTPDDKSKPVTVIDYDKLTEFFSNMSSIELQMYINKTPSTPNCKKEKPAIWRGKEPTTEFDFIQMKHRYYEKVYINYHKHAKGIDVTDIREEVLVKFEMEMALAYLKTYIWYYYYQSGYSVGKPLDNSYYEYCYPPLYNSLYILLAGKKENFFIEFSHEYNKDLIPVERDLDYFEKLPCMNHLQNYMTLQKDDYESLYPNASERIFDRDVEHVKTSKNFEDKNIPLRVHSDFRPAYLQVYAFLDIHTFIDKYRSHTIIQEKKKTVIGKTTDNMGRGRVSASAFALGNKKLVFGELPDNKLP